MQSSAVPKIWLASSSPRRAQLLEMLGVPFERVASTFEEPEPTEEDHALPERYVNRLANNKAFLCHWEGQERPPGYVEERDADRTIVLAADTVVWHEGRILNKPRDQDEARAMLRKLCGSRHCVLTGLCLRFPREQGLVRCIAHEETWVTFAPRSDEWIARYVATGEPMDKAGAYAAQGLGSLLIERIEGDFFNVVGLPLFRLSEMLRGRGIPIEEFWTASA
jgi:septum formation protein